MDKKQFTNTEN